MVELKINGELVETGEEVVISYNYDLYSDVLSNFTTSYTNAIDLPMTSTNKKVFGYPNITYGDIGYYTFELYKDGVLYDTGSVLVDHVTDDVISINLFSQLITKGEELSNIQSFAECITKNQHDMPVIAIPSYNSETGEWEVVNKYMSRGDISMNVSSLAAGTSTQEYIVYKDSNDATTQDYLYLATANIGKPSALNCDSYFDANADPKIAQWPEGGERTFIQTLAVSEAGNLRPAFQTRFYDLQPVMPLDVLFLNLFKKRGITISQGVHRLFNGETNICPKSYITLPSLREWLEGQTYEATTVGPTTSTTTATTFTGVFPIDSKLKITDFLNDYSQLWGTLKDSRHIAVQLLTFQVWHGAEPRKTGKVMVYTDGAKKYVKSSPSMLVRQWYRNSSVKKLQRKNLAEASVTFDDLNDSLDYTVLITCTGVYQTENNFQSNQGQVYVSNNQGSWEHDWYATGGKCSTSGQRTSFKLMDYFSSFKVPWKVAVDICKQFNLRFKYTSPNTMELCLGSAVDSKVGVDGTGLDCEYYDIPDVDTDGVIIDEYLDWSNFSIKPQVFGNKSVTFTPEFNATNWDDYVSKNYVYPYGTRVEDTNYPIKSAEEWFDWNALKHLSTYPKWKYVLPPIPGRTATNYNFNELGLSQAFDKDGNQISIAYSLCTLRAGDRYAFICNEMQASDFCYYGQTYLFDHLYPELDAIPVKPMPYVSSIVSVGGLGYEQYLFGDRVVPSDLSVTFTGFGDVIDQMESKKLVLNVFLDQMRVGINDFVRKVYYIDGSNYIVGGVHSYAIGSGKPCEVEFIKIVDMDNYRVMAPAYHTVTFSCTHGSVGATVDGIGIQSGDEVQRGKTVVFTITPDEGYEYLGTNPESVIVLNDVVKNYECTEVVEYVTLNATAVNGSISATVGGNPVQLPYTAAVGTSVVLRALPNEHYHFTNWDDGEIMNPRTFVMLADETLSTTCALDVHTVTLNITNGTGVGGGTFNYGTTTQISVTPDSGYRFVEWADGNTDNPRTITVTGDVTYSSACVVSAYAVNFSCANGSVGATVDGIGIQSGDSVEYGKTVIFTITPDEGYEYTGTNPESVVVSGAVTKDYVCTEIPVWTGLKFTANNGTAGFEWCKSTPAGTFVTTIQYSIDSGLTWHEYPASYSPTPFEFSEIWIKADNSTYYTDVGYNYFHISVTTDTDITISGNIMSMIQSSGFETLTTLTSERTFQNLFDIHYPRVDASGLVLPATTLSTGCYASMFQGCRHLTSAPELPATTLADYCYRYMFYQCTSLTSAPELPATTLADYCYEGMFRSCTSLTSAPSLPATTLASYCYNWMFWGCTSLTSAPSLPATELADYCYQYMFNGCTSLTSAPSLPATTLASSCYLGMFTGCTSITTAPEIPATTIADNCCKSMFEGCTSLVTAMSELPATTLASSCYSGMFEECTSLVTAVRDLPATELKEYSYQRMFYNCNNLTGPVRISATSPYTSENVRGAYQMFYNTARVSGSGGTIIVGGEISDWKTSASITSSRWTVLCPFKITAIGNTIISFNQVGEWSGTWPIQYSYDGLSWESYTMGEEFQLTDDQALYWIGQKNYTAQSSSVYRQFAIQGDAAFSGSIMSLLDGVGSSTSLANYGNYTFHKLFAGCSGITSMPYLPATTLTKSCYESMFEGCTSLITALRLRAGLAVECYQNMFKDCTSLVTAMSELPATILQTSCYYGMFQNCSSLVNAPILPAHTLQDACYAFMFDGCTNLETIHIATDDISVSQCTLSWVRGVTEGGDFYTSNPDMWEYGEHGVPVGWEIHEEQFELPEENSENI